MRNLSKIFLAFGGSLLLSHCGGANIQTGPAGPDLSSAKIQHAVFGVGSDAPTDLVISALPEFRGTAFIVTDFPLPGVIPYDLDTGKTSTRFPVLDLQKLGVAATIGYTRALEILSPTQALLLGGSGLLSFNPSSGEVYDVVDLEEEIDLGEQTLELSAGDGLLLDHFSPNFAGDVAVLKDRVFVGMDNIFFDGPQDAKTYFVQGLVRVFDLKDHQLLHAETPFFPVPGFNPTGMTVHEGKLLLTLTGATKIHDGGQTPLTASKLLKIDPESLEILDELDLGLVAANYRTLAVTKTGRGFVGSAAFPEIYEIDLKSFKVLRGKENPIRTSESQDDFITDQTLAPPGDRMFVSSFNHSEIVAVDLAGEARTVLPTRLSFHLEPNPGVTGIGSFEFRPGQGGVDFQGPDLWVLTAYPGTLSNALTY